MEPGVHSLPLHFDLFHRLFLCFLYAGLLCFLSCPAQNIALCITTFRGQGASMAQQDPCWIDLQSLLESSVLYFLLRTSSANAVSVSAAELQT